MGCQRLQLHQGPSTRGGPQIPLLHGDSGPVNATLHYEGLIGIDFAMKTRSFKPYNTISALSNIAKSSLCYIKRSEDCLLTDNLGVGYDVNARFQTLVKRVQNNRLNQVVKRNLDFLDLRNF